jgi:hypothetical protein
MKKGESRKDEDTENSKNGQEDSKKMQKTGKKGKGKKRTNGSARVRKRKQERLQRWEKSGIHIGSQNIAGISLLKIYMLLGTYTLDVLCL